MRRVATLVAVLAIGCRRRARGLGRPGGHHAPECRSHVLRLQGQRRRRARRLVCSGSYAGPSKTGANDVFLTAGHRLPPAELGIPASALLVSFDPRTAGTVSPRRSRSAPTIRCLASGATRRPPRPRHPAPPTGSVPAGTPAVRLPTAGYLDALKASGALKFRIVDIVGYGVTPIWEPRRADAVRLRRRPPLGHVDHHRPRQCRRALQPAAQRRRHGVGPLLRRLRIAAVRPRHAARPLRDERWQRQCNANNQNYRVDTPLARAFLGQFLNLP